MREINILIQNLFQYLKDTIQLIMEQYLNFLELLYNFNSTLKNFKQSIRSSSGFTNNLQRLERFYLRFSQILHFYKALIKALYRNVSWLYRVQVPKQLIQLAIMKQEFNIEALDQYVEWHQNEYQAQDTQKKLALKPPGIAIGQKLPQSQSLDHMKKRGQSQVESEYVQQEFIQQGCEPVEAYQKRLKSRSTINIQILQRLKVLFSSKLESNKPSFEEISIKVGLGYSTVTSLWNQWLYEKNFAPRIIRLRQKHNRLNRLTHQRSKILCQILSLNPLLTQTQIAEEMNKRYELKTFGKQISKYTVHHLLKLNQYSKKYAVRVPLTRNSPQIKRIRKQYCEWITQKLKDPRNQFFYLDQSEINLFLVRDSGWGRKGQKILLRCPNSKEQNISLLLSIGKNGNVYHIMHEGSYNKQLFMKNLYRIFQEIKRNQGNKQIFVIQNNCWINSQYDCTALGEKFNFNVVYLPPYSPMLNPVYCFFHSLKTKIRKSRFSKCQQLKKQIVSILKKEKPRNFDSYYKGIQLYIEKGLKSEQM